MKKCRICGLELPKENFYKDNKYKDGVKHECKECTKQQNKERRKVKAMLEGRIYNERDYNLTEEEKKERHKKRCREWHYKNRANETPEQREIRLAKLRVYNRTKRNHSKEAEKKRIQRANETPEQREARLQKAREYTRQWKANNKDKVKEQRKLQYQKEKPKYISKKQLKKEAQNNFNNLLADVLKEEGLI